MQQIPIHYVEKDAPLCTLVRAFYYACIKYSICHKIYTLPCVALDSLSWQSLTNADILFHICETWNKIYVTRNEECCATSSYHGQGHVIISHGIFKSCTGKAFGKYALYTMKCAYISLFCFVCFGLIISSVTCILIPPGGSLLWWVA